MNVQKTTRNRIVAGLAVVLTSLAAAGTASADVIGDCSLTGYTFMGGGSAYVSTPSGPNAKNYFTASSLNYDFMGQNMWGYGWAKFENLEATPVASAHLVFDLFAIGAMSPAEPTPETPAILNVYDPAAIDVADLGDSATLRGTLRDNLDSSGSVLDSLTMTTAGTYSIDITALYNAWVADPDTNHGVVFVGPDDGEASRYASFGHASGAAPYISTVPIPEPATMGLLAFGGLAILRRRSKP